MAIPPSTNPSGAQAGALLENMPGTRTSTRPHLHAQNEAQAGLNTNTMSVAGNSTQARILPSSVTGAGASLNTRALPTQETSITKYGLSNLNNIREKMSSLCSPLPSGGDDGGVSYGSDAHSTDAINSKLADEYQAVLVQMQRDRAEWAERQEEQLKVVRACLGERDQLRRQEATRQMALQAFQQEMSSAVDALSAERLTWVQESADKDRELSSLHYQLSEAKDAHSKEKQLAMTLTQSKATLEQQLASTSTQNAQTNDAQEKEWASKFNSLKVELDRVLESQRSRTEQHNESETSAHAKRKELEAKVRELEAEKQQLVWDNSKFEYDRDAVKSQNVLVETRHEAEKASVEATTKADMERLLLQRISEEQDNHKAVLELTRERHKSQVEELNERHDASMKQATTRFNDGVQAKTEAMKELKGSHEREIERLQGRLKDSESSIQRLTDTLKSRDTAKVQAFHRLGSQLRNTLNASVSRVTTEIANVSQEFGDDTASMVSASAMHMAPSEADDTLLGGANRSAFTPYASAHESTLTHVPSVETSQQPTAVSTTSPTSQYLFGSPTKPSETASAPRMVSSDTNQANNALARVDEWLSNYQPAARRNQHADGTSFLSSTQRPRPTTMESLEITDISSHTDANASLHSRFFTSGLSSIDLPPNVSFKIALDKLIIQCLLC